MFSIICGEKGKGKTQVLLDKANNASKEARGSIVFIDKSTKHMHELDRNIRLINIFDYPIHSYESFLGFVSGIVSQDHDLETIFLDNFLKLSHLSEEEVDFAIEEFENLSKKFGVNFIVSMSANVDNLPEKAKEAVIVSL